jgi:hypothetical protein
MGDMPVVEDTSDILDQKVGNMTIAELTKTLDGKLKASWGTIGLIMLFFLIAILISIVAFVVVWVVFSKQLSQESGARDYALHRLSSSSNGQNYQITKTTEFLYSVVGGTSSSIAITVSRPDASIAGAPVSFVTNITYNSDLAADDVTSALLNVSSTGTSGDTVVFRFLNGSTGSSFNLIASGAQLIVNSVAVAGSYTASRHFVWGDANTLVEVDSSIGFQPLLLQ